MFLKKWLAIVAVGILLGLTTSAYNISSRNRTTALVNWSPPNWTSVGTAGPDQRTPDLSSIIQEIVNINVNLSPGVPTATVTVDYAVTDITTDSSDYSPYPTTGMLTFLPGVTSQHISITIGADMDPEGDEQFKVSLSNPDGGGADVGLGLITEHIYTIIDSSPKVQFFEASLSGDESAGLVSLWVMLCCRSLGLRPSQ